MKRVFVFLVLSLMGAAFTVAPKLQAAEPEGFSLQVTPSPLVSVVKPGETTELELKIRNANTAPEQLKIETRAFVIKNDGTVDISNDKPADIASWVKFSAPTFAVDGGAWYTQKVSIQVPPDAGFSYYFALMISRTKDPSPSSSAGRQLKGSVAIFTLLNVDRPGATRTIDLVDVKATKQLYEYLPAQFDITLKNTGNTIAQPYGNVFVQRSSSDTQPLATLKVNDARGYILPGSQRVLSATWNDGFPVYATTTDATGRQKTSLSWDFANLSHIRIGKYTAKVVAVYNDGQRDIPIVREITFWVFPWKALLGLIAVVIALFFLIRFLIRRKTDKAVKKALADREK